uniref:Uncharacterized protein n=1 Tax=Leersia perrieri TaxID=77586 RepID=A0A0D9WCK4_9ORYZ
MTTQLHRRPRCATAVISKIFAVVPTSSMMKQREDVLVQSEQSAILLGNHIYSCASTCSCAAIIFA